jgi:predicted DNA-binding protein (MmcQ/YjbR family)
VTARRATAVKDDPLPKLREICLALPECDEKPFGGHTSPSFRVRDKIFAMCTGEESGGRDELWCKAPPGAQQVIVSSDAERYFVPPYVGKNGWVGVRLHRGIDWHVVAELVIESYRMTAPKKLIAQLS